MKNNIIENLLVEKTFKTSPSDHRTSEKAKNRVVETMVRE